MNHILFVTIFIAIVQHSSQSSNSFNDSLSSSSSSPATTERSPTSSPLSNSPSVTSSPFDYATDESIENSQPKQPADSSENNNSNKIQWPVDLLSLDYSSLIGINKDCPQTPDRCFAYKRSKMIDNLDCSCDQDCKRLGNCCLDSPELKAIEGGDPRLASGTAFVERLETFNRFRQDYDCKELLNQNSFRSLLVRSKCPIDFRNELVRQKCENGSSDFVNQFEYNYKDPYTSIPVTSTKSRITYSNIFCALCNEHKDDLIETIPNLASDESSELRFWKMNVTCDNVTPSNLTLDQPLDEFIKHNFSYESSTSSWVIQFTNTNGDLEKRSCSLKLHVPADLEFYIKPCKQNLIERCSTNWTTDTLERRTVQALCDSYQSRVNHFDLKQEYRNVHCAICNFVDITQLGCPSNLQPASLADIFDGRSNLTPYFTSLFDVNFVISNSNIVGKKSMSYFCPEVGTIYDPFYNQCRNLICDFNQFFSMGKCRLPPIIKPILSTDQIDNNKTEELITIDGGLDDNQPATEPSAASNDEQSIANGQPIANGQQFTSEFRKCAKIRLTSGYMELKNDSIYLQQYDQIVDRGNYNLTNSELLICVPFSQLLDKFENHYSLVAYVCLIFSIICLTLYLTIFCLVPDLRNLSGRNLGSLCVSLIMVYYCFAIAPLNLVQNEIKFCKLIAFVKYYGLLASFCWAGIIAFDIYQTIRNSLNAFRHKTGPQTGRFIVYSLICWSLPMFAVVFAWLTDVGQFNASIPDEFRPNFGKNKECWFMHRKSLLVFFVLPVGLVTILNLIFFVLTSKNLLLTTNRSKLKLSGQSTSKFDFNLYLRLFLLMGLTWLFGFTASYFDKIYLWYLFTLFNTLQGVFIFIEFGCKRVVMRKLKIRLAKLLFLDHFNLNKDSSLQSTVVTACRGTPTNQSTISLSTNNKILNSDHPDNFKTKEHFFNRLNERSLSRSFGDLYTKTTGSLDFYSSDSLNKSQLNQQFSQPISQQITQQFGQQFNQPITQPINQQIDQDSYLNPSLLHNRQQIPSTFSASSIMHDNPSSSFKYPYSQTNANNTKINNSQINRWFDWSS